jgi:hypothetical protein
MVELTEKESKVVDELYRYFVEQEHEPKREELYRWVIRRMQKYMMINKPPTVEQFWIIATIVNSVLHKGYE